MSSGLHNRQFLAELLNLPGVVTLTLADDLTRYFWNPDVPFADTRYSTYLAAAQRAGVYPDLERRYVMFDAELLTKTFPAMRKWRAELEALGPLTFSGQLPGCHRPQPALRVIKGGRADAGSTDQEAV